MTITVKEFWITFGFSLCFSFCQEEMALHKDKEWPNKEECDTHVQKFPAYNEYPTTYLPAENKGFE